MNNDEIIQMLRELAESADAEGAVKSKTIRIPLEPNREEAVKPEKKRGKLRLPGFGATDDEEDEREDDAAEDLAETQLQQEAVQADEDTDYLDEEEDFDEEDLSDFSIIPSEEQPVRRFQRAKLRTADTLSTAVEDEEVSAPQAGETAESAEETGGLQEEAPSEARSPEESGRRFSLSGTLGGALQRVKALLPAKKEKTQIPEESESVETPLQEEIPDADEMTDAEEITDAQETDEAHEIVDTDEMSESAEAPTAAHEEEPQERTAKESSAEEEAAQEVAAEDNPSGEAQLQEAYETAEMPQTVSESADKAQEAPAESAEKVPTVPAGEDPAEAKAPVVPAEPAVKKSWSEVLRETPVEEADFDSDAHLFRSEGVSTEEQPPSLKEKLADWKVRLADRGIGKLQLIIAAALLCVLIIALIVGAVIHSQRAKRANVTADEGLVLTVERQPAQWTSSGEVTLGIRTKQNIQSVTVNGEPYTVSGENSAQVTLEADRQDLEVMVVTEETVLSGRAVLKRVDGEAPDVRLSQEGELVTITAEDAGSGLADIYYGKLTGWSSVPAYQPYTEPFTPEKDSLYAYYAVDNAGNISMPQITDMTQATALSVDRTSVTLFPGDTYRLDVKTVPEHAFLNQLTMASSDPAVVSVSDSGELTALAEGSADVTISAEGVATLVCRVDVRTEAEVTISAVGDVTLGEDVSFNTLTNFSTMYSMKGSSYFFDNVRSIFQNDGITFANMEGTLTDQGEREDKTYAFRGDPSYVNILKDGGIDVVTLANNHSSDYGEVSLSDTQKYLNEAGIDYVKDDIVALKESGGVRVGFIGIYCLNSTLDQQKALLKQDIDELKAQNADVIVVAFHWGEEKAEKPSNDQIDLAHTAVEYGADLIVGHHPHVLQGIEIYQGKYIAYSLGNFCFGGNSDPSDKDTMIFQQTFRLTRNNGMESASINVIPCSISSDAASNNYQPTVAAGEEAQRIMDKINARSAAFGKTTFTYNE